MSNSKRESDAPQNIDDQASLQALKDLDTIRQIIASPAISEQEKQRKEEARKFVADVLTEALHEREYSDASISQALAPIVDSSLKRSAKAQRKEMTDYMFPLVGELVRKYVTAFIRDFIEKTNEIVENSLTLKSLSWRYKAWRSGVSFSSYVAAQIYTYQVHQVLLIHRETGILLNSASLQIDDKHNADVISSMLSAVADFVSDSFKQIPSEPNKSEIAQANKQEVELENRLPNSQPNNTSQDLNEIRSGDFTLHIKHGPHALLVSAVTGSISPPAKTKLQYTLEQIHSLYSRQLSDFSGDTSVFAPTSLTLQECLMSEQKDADSNKRAPWFAFILICIAIALSIWYTAVSWQTNTLHEKIYALPSDQGIIINHSEVVGLKQINVSVLRDPNAVTFAQWINNNGIDKQASWLIVEEVPFVSISETVVHAKIERIVAKVNQLSGSESLQFNADSNELNGELNAVQSALLTRELSKITGLEQFSLTQNIDKQQLTPQNEDISERAMTLLSGEISQLQIDFALASALLDEEELKKLSHISDTFAQLVYFADELGLDAKLLVLGASDNVGSLSVNQALSIARAQNTADALVALGIDKTQVMTSGLGIIEDAPPNTNVRKAIIHVIINNK